MNSWHLYGLMVMAQVTAITVVAAVIIACLQRWAAPRHSVGALALTFVLLSFVSALFLPQSGWLVRDTSPPSQAASFAPTRVETSQVGINHYDVRTNWEQLPAVGPSNKLLTRHKHSEASAAVIHESNATVSEVAARKSHGRWRGLIYADRNTWFAICLNLAGSVWLTGIAVYGWTFLRRRQQLHRLARSLQTAPISSDVFNKVRTATGLVELPRVATSDFAPTPFVLGCWRPVVVLPQFLVEAGATSQLREILIHECAHIRRGDPWMHMAQRVASVLFWLHPGVHWINRQIARSREELCDNFVLAKTDAVDYAQTLLDLAERCGGTSRALSLLGFFTSQWTLERRISGLLDRNRSRQIRAGLTLPVIAGIALAVLAVAVGGTGVLGQIAPEAGAIAPAVAPSLLQLRAVDTRSGRPLSGVIVSYNLYTNHEKVWATWKQTRKASP